jgi:hypothetical protein
LSDLFAGRQAVRHHAEGEQDRLDDDGDDQQGHGRTGSSLWQASSDAFLAAAAFSLIVGGSSSASGGSVTRGAGQG